MFSWRALLKKYRNEMEKLLWNAMFLDYPGWTKNRVKFLLGHIQKSQVLKLSQIRWNWATQLEIRKLAAVKALQLVVPCSLFPKIRNNIKNKLSKKGNCMNYITDSSSHDIEVCNHPRDWVIDENKHVAFHASL